MRLRSDPAEIGWPVPVAFGFGEAGRSRRGVSEQESKRQHIKALRLMLFKTAHNVRSPRSSDRRRASSALPGSLPVRLRHRSYGSAGACTDAHEWNPANVHAEPRQNRIVATYRCLECDEILEFQQLVIEHEQLLAEHKRLQSPPFSASEHTEHRRQIAAHGAKVAAFRSRVFGGGPPARS